MSCSSYWPFFVHTKFSLKFGFYANNTNLEFSNIFIWDNNTYICAYSYYDLQKYLHILCMNWFSSILLCIFHLFFSTTKPLFTLFTLTFCWKSKLMIFQKNMLKLIYSLLLYINLLFFVPFFIVWKEIDIDWKRHLNSCCSSLRFSQYQNSNVDLL